jgi:hypothetical protein
MRNIIGVVKKTTTESGITTTTIRGIFTKENILTPHCGSKRDERYDSTGLLTDK